MGNPAQQRGSWPALPSITSDCATPCLSIAATSRNGGSCAARVRDDAVEGRIEGMISGEVRIVEGGNGASVAEAGSAPKRPAVV